MHEEQHRKSNTGPAAQRHLRDNLAICLRLRAAKHRVEAQQSVKDLAQAAEEKDADARSKSQEGSIPQRACGEHEGRSMVDC